MGNKREMNKLGIHVSLFTKNWSEDYIQFFPKAAGLGFKAVEIPLLDPDSTDTSRIKNELKANGLSVFCGTGLAPETDIASRDLAKRKKGEEHLKKCVDIAAEIGSPTLEGVLYASWGKSGVVSESEYAFSAEVLNRVALYAGRSNIRLCLECLNRYESSFLNTAAQARKFIDRIDAENVGVHLDTYHMNIEEATISEGIRAAGEKLFFLHLSENTRGYPGSGSIDWKKLFKTLKDLKYTGPLALESYVLNGSETGDATYIWRPIEKDTDSSLKRSVDYLHPLIANL